MYKITILIIIILSFNFSSYSQTLTLETDNNGLQCQYVLIDVTASGFPANVGAFSLFINVDGNVVESIGKQGGLSGVSVNQSAYNQIGLVWSNPGGADIDGLITTLVLHYHGNSTVLDWDETSDEIVLTDLITEITPTYVNGAVSEGSYTFNTYYVDASVTVSGSGLSWATAFKTITEAANLPLKTGEQVLIKPGTYNEKVVIKSNAGYSVLPQTGIVLSDTNKITFPNGANLSCIDLASYPDQYYAYIYRSWGSNNGYYKVIEVNDAQNYVRVAGAKFVPETGTTGIRSKLMAAIGRPVIYRKDPTALESQRVIVNTSSVGGTTDAMYIGLAIGDGQTNADSCNWNLIEGIDITGGSGHKGLHIQCSAYNTFAKGKIYSAASGTGGTGAILTGTPARNAKFNTLQNNEIYNTPYQGVLIGYTTNQAAYNFSNFNHVVDNNFYLSGAGATARFNNAVKVGYGDRNNVIDGNTFHDFSLYTINNGALLVESKADSTLVTDNVFKNIGNVNTGIHACIMINDTIWKVYAFNNIIYADDTINNDVYAFRISGRKDTLSKVCFNTINKIDNGFYLEDAGGPALDIDIQNNIIAPTGSYFTNIGTSGRFTITHNLFRFTPGAPYATGTGNIIGDPLFIDPNSPSMFGLMLMPASPCFDTGIVVTNVSRDYLLKSRNAPEPTLGAFEGLMECNWTGTFSTNWHSTQNWAYQIVPMNFMSVVVPNTANDPVIFTSNATCNSITLQNGATIKVQPPRTLTVAN